MPFNSPAHDRRFFASKCIPVLLAAEMGLRPWRRFLRDMDDEFHFPCGSCTQSGEPCETSPDFLGCLPCLRAGLRCTAHDDSIQHALMRHFPSKWRDQVFSDFYAYHGYHAYARGGMHRKLGGLTTLLNATSVIATRISALTRRQSLPRLNSALDQLRESTFVLAIGRSVMQQQLLSRHVLLHDIASVLKSMRHGCLSNDRGLAIMENIFRDRAADVWEASRFPFGPCPELRAEAKAMMDLD